MNAVIHSLILYTKKVYNVKKTTTNLQRLYSQHSKLLADHSYVLESANIAHCRLLTLRVTNSSTSNVTKF